LRFAGSIVGPARGTAIVIRALALLGPSLLEPRSTGRARGEMLLKLLERNVAHIEQRLVLVAPPAAAIPTSFRNVLVAPDQHVRLVREVQRMRASVYLEDGALDRRQLSAEGLHRTPEDQRSWHLLFMNHNRQVSACVWYLQHQMDASFGDLRVRRCPLARNEGWSAKLWHAVECELARARRDNLCYAEVGGWAVAPESRCTSEGLLLALAAYSLGRRMGGALGITMATVRHSSSAILRRVGGSCLYSGADEIPSYYDPSYRCTMELLRFDSRQPSAKYASLIMTLTQKLTEVQIIASGLWHPATAVSIGDRRPQHAA